MNTKIYFPPKDRKALLYLLALIILGNIGLSTFKKAVSYSEEEKLQLISAILEKQKNRSDIQRPSNDLTPAPILTAPFNPNLISPEDLTKYGMSSYAASNLDKYIKSGGVIYSRTDLQKIYGMDSLWLESTNHLIQYPTRKIKNQISKMSSNAPVSKSTHTPSTKVERASTPADIVEQASTFDPNIAPMSKLLSQGLSKYAAANLIKYRSKGGRIYKKSDLLKIYGVDSATFSKVTPNMIIEAETHTVVNSVVTKDVVRHDPKSEETTKVKGEKIDLNNTTAEELIALNGIGPVLSQRIIEYKDQLGGYLDIQQIKEIYALSEETYESIKDQISVAGKVKKVYIPSLSFKEVLRHPYMDYETTKLLKNTSIIIFDEKLEDYISEGIVDKRILPYLHLTDPELVSLAPTE